MSETFYERASMNLTSCIVGKNEGGYDGWLIQFPYSAEFLNEFKDSIPRDYREWNPATKTWWVDGECGGLLAGLFDNWDMPITQPKNTMRMREKPKCPICNGKGLVPSKALGKFSGKPIPNCFSDCECKELEKEYSASHYCQVRPQDFDFPMSYSFYRSLCREHGWPDPGDDRAPEMEDKPQVVEHIHRHSDMGKKELDLLQQTVLKVDYLEKRLNERKPGKQVSKFTIGP